MEDVKILNTNAIAFIGLAQDYCTTLENAMQSNREEFLNDMLRLLPRIYISATDLSVNIIETGEAYIPSALEEDYYDSVRRSIEQITGPDDIYLEVFEEEMKYSDTPVSASISEGLADIFQVLFNFLQMVRDSTDEVIGLALVAVKDDFKDYWSAILCNVLRAINHLAYTIDR